MPLKSGERHKRLQTDDVPADTKVVIPECGTKSKAYHHVDEDSELLHAVNWDGRETQLVTAEYARRRWYVECKRCKEIRESDQNEPQ